MPNSPKARERGWVTAVGWGIMRLLLVSNSTGPDGNYLDWCENELTTFLGAGAHVLFVPFAGVDEGAYGKTAVDRLALMDVTAEWADRSDDFGAALRRATAVFVGGGNTFLLLDRLARSGMLDAIRDRVRDGLPYVGTSAGANVAGPTICTTNDMPIVEPPSFAAMGLVPFQINPHYIDRDPDSTHKGETRDQRLLEFLTQNDTPVVALREGALLDVSDGSVEVRGRAGARVYLKGQDRREVPPGTRIDDLVGGPEPGGPDAGRSSKGIFPRPARSGTGS
jgi:dipeptidase E